VNDPKKPFSDSVHDAAEALAAAGSAAAKLEHAAVEVIETELARRPRWRVALSVLGWTLVSIYFLFATLVLGLRYWILPNIGQHTGLIEQKISQVVGERVTIGELTAGWDGLRPELDLRDLRVHDGAGNLVLALPAVEAVLSWTSMLVNSVRFHSLTIDRPDLAIRRDAQGEFHVAGLRLGKSASDEPGFADWLLGQSEVSVRSARITWADELRAAPLLELSGVGLVLRNSGSSHRFALQASVPRELASMLDVRGELNGIDLADPAGWSGRLFAELDYINLGAWRRWVDYPVELRAGEGGMRMWVSFARNQITEATADVTLARVETRLAPELPMMELDFLSGRLGGKRSATQTEVLGRHLTLRSRGGAALPPAEFALRLQVAAGQQKARGEFSADTLELEPLARLSGHLPLPQPMRQWLDAAQPRGHVQDLKLSWSDAGEKIDEYNVRTRFTGLGMRAHAGIPGLSGLAGTVNATEKAGSLSLARTPATAKPRPERIVIDLGSVLGGPLQLDSLSGEVGWTLAADKFELKLRDLAFANADAAGTVAGSFATRAGSPGVIDLTGSLNRADGRAVWRYIPYIPDSLRDYLRAALVAGQSRDVQLRLKGDLSQFPFDDPKQGRFSVVARVSDAELNYLEGWPRISAIAGDVIIEGKQLTVRAQRGSVLGTRLSNVRATIPDMIHHEEQLSVEGQADGPSAEFLRFVEVSPVGGYIDGVTRDMRATGTARLQLKLDVPLRKPEGTRVAGNVQLQNSQVTFDPDLPPLIQANGRFDFSESAFAIKGVSAQFLGGPVLVNAQTRDGGVVINAQGTATVAAVRRMVAIPGMEHVGGSAPWRGTITARRGIIDAVVDSPLQGVTIDLPPPFYKSAQETLSLHVERSNSADAETAKRFRGLRPPAKGDVISVSLGSSAGRSMNALVVRRADGKGYALERASLGLNETAALPVAAGLAVNGNLPYVDVDRWQPLLGGGSAAPSAAVAGAPAAAAPAPSAPAGQRADINGVNLRIGMLDVAGKRIHDLVLRAQPRGTQWNASVDAREMKGEVRWRPEGRGVVQARLAHLVTPGDRPGPVAPAAETTRELPALDVIADSFTLRDRQLGRLELVAVNDARDWRIEKLQLSNPESSLNVDGIWQSWAARPSLSVNVRLETSDIGRFLTRMGYPGVMASGASKLEGKIGWAGTPQAPDFSTLTGNLKMSADRGQFLKADPGVAKLLGVLSLQSLVTLDLRDLFREGFAYDTITGTATITKGVLGTSDFFMKGASAQVRMSGTIDLARETQNLHLRVVPALGDGASTVAGLMLANPIFGLGATLLQRLLKDPLGQVFAVEYDVTGSWDDPKVARTRVDTPAATGKGE
jgi:uncharacterized protein (TIGR02099 family)